MNYLELTVDQILPPAVPLREELDAAAFAELVADIKARGLLQPVVVTEEDGQYRLVAGYRRWRAAMEAHLVTIPCVVQDFTRLGAAAATIVENLHREDISPLDEARKFAELEDEYNLSAEEIGQLIGKSVTYVTSRLSLLRAPQDLQDALRAGQINFSTARELMRCPYDVERQWLLGHASNRAVSAETVRHWVDEANARHERMPEGTAPTSEQLSTEGPPEIMAACEFHRGEVPLNATLAFRVCQPCYNILVEIRERLEKEGKDAAPPAPPPPPEPEQFVWAVSYSAEWTKGEEFEHWVWATDREHAIRWVSETFALAYPNQAFTIHDAVLIPKEKGGRHVYE